MIERGSWAYWRGVLALCCGALAVFANLNISQPLMPALSAEFGLSPLEASWSISLPYITLGISMLFYGPVSDALGRRGLLILSLLGTVVCSVLISSVDGYSGLLWLRALQGFFLAGLPAIAIAYMGEEFSRKAMLSAVGLYISFTTVGGISGRMISGYFTQAYDWQTAFLALGVFSAVLLLIFAVMLPASTQFKPSPANLRVMLADCQRHLRNPMLLGAYCIGGLNFLMFCNLYTFMTYRLSEEPFALPAGVLGLLFLTYLSGSVSSAASGRISLKLGQSRSMLLGIVLTMMGVGLTLSNHLQLIVLGLLVCSSGFFFCHSVISAWVNRHTVGAPATASSLYLLFYYTGGAVGSFYFSPLWVQGHWYGVALGAVLVLLIASMLALLLRRSEKPIPSFQI